MTTGERQVVLGASGGIGSAVTAALAERGVHAVAVNRSGDAPSPDGVERAAADVSELDDLRRVLRGASVVYHCVQPPYERWEREFPAMNRQIVTATAESGAKLVVADNLYMYDQSGPISERSVVAPPTSKGRLRAAMAGELLEAHERGDLRVTLGRASDYYGPHGANSTIGERLFDQILRGKKAQWMGSLDQPHACAFLPDVGRALVTLGQRDDADGRAWVLPATTITGRSFIEMAARAAGTDPKPAVVTPAMMKLAGLFVPFLRAYAEMTVQWTQPFTVDAGDFQARFTPAAPTPLEPAIAETVAWFHERSAESPRAR